MDDATDIEEVGILVKNMRATLDVVETVLTRMMERNKSEQRKLDVGQDRRKRDNE